MAVLWESKLATLTRVAGRLRALVVGTREPEHLHYSPYNPTRHGGHKWGGTLYGSAESGEYHDDFLGSVQYELILVEEGDGSFRQLQNGLVLRALQRAMDTGLEATLYLLMEKNSDARAMLVALRFGRLEREASGTVGGLAAPLRASFRRQARRLVIPLGIALGEFPGLGGLVIASLPAALADLLLGWRWLPCLFPSRSSCCSPMPRVPWAGGAWKPSPTRRS